MAIELTIKGISERIYFIRGYRVRFPEDFMFQLTASEYENLRYQIGTSSFLPKHGGLRYSPFVFTQEGVAMLSGVLNSERAIHVNIAVMRTFVKLRELLENNGDLAKKIDLLERQFLDHDQHFKVVFAAIRQLMAVGTRPKVRRIKGLENR